MTRRLFVKIFGWAIGFGLPFPGAQGAETTQDLASWAKQVYEREAIRQNSHAPRPRNPDHDDFLPLFAPDLRAMIQRPTSARTRMPEGPILNAFFGWGVLPGHRVELQAVRASRGGDPAESVEIDYLLRGEPRRLRIVATRSATAWEIVDIVYDRGESYAAFHRRRIGDQGHE